MVSYLILCRSLTYAQRTARVLEQTNIRCYVKRTPRNIAIDGCGYCVTLNSHHIDYVLKKLHEEGVPPKQVFLKQEDGTYCEVGL